MPLYVYTCIHALHCLLVTVCKHLTLFFSSGVLWLHTLFALFYLILTATFMFYYVIQLGKYQSDYVSSISICMYLYVYTYTVYTYILFELCVLLYAYVYNHGYRNVLTYFYYVDIDFLVY